MSDGFAGIILGFIVSFIVMAFILVHNFVHMDEIVRHQNCAYYHPVTGNLTWLDSNESK